MYVLLASSLLTQIEHILKKTHKNDTKTHNKQTKKGILKVESVQLMNKSP